ncbi:Peroxisomal biogenesis factor 2 [Fulvia fulva]|nr:Peroxisomal biogenesis factor 2 [Fulvia fulva]KAK4628065.1 Peroxisomal biogenesis factor 2 [Fulvia fulva]WPV14298.1 Peroxisomal biogenesis factor 2 [Fulvia fulva]WPV28058.1 Peroxisomal biogenesis factor 2 [Fulvia fulva]
MADFAGAQRRILERRAAREQAIAAESRAYQDTRTEQLTRLPPTIRTYAYDLLRYYDLLKSPYGTSPAFRVGQVDAELLDEALLGLLRKQAGEGLKLFGAHLKDDWNAEITALLCIVYWKLSIWDHGTSYGASLQGLKYIDARGKDIFEAERMRKDATKLQRALYGLITVVGRYGWTRWEERLSSLENGYDEPSPLIKRLSQVTTYASTTRSITSFLSFLVFLYNGRYRTLTDRILRLRLVPSSNQTSREVSFEFLNRQLVWHAFTEFLLFLLPLVGISRWRRWLSRAWKKTKTTTIKLFSGAPTDEEDEDDDIQKGELSFLPERTCAICYQDQNPTGGQSEQDIISSSAAAANSGITGSAMTDITNPYQAESCGCIYCFVCLAQRIEAEEGEGWVCLRCGEIVKECRPWHGDVVVRRERRSTDVSTKSGSRPSSRRKSVMFDLDAEERALEDEEREDSAMETVDPMPIEEAEWERDDHSDDE